jgi:basic amino acid/polyamine antiporter, APA family
MTHRELPRTLGLADLALLAVGSVIGSGIFLVPSSVLRQCGGSFGLALLVWVAAGILSILGALTYGELGAMHPAAGGLYVYVRDGFGRFIAFLYGWTLFAVIGTGSVATLAVAFATYLQEFVSLTAPLRTAVAVVMIGVVGAVNVWGTRKSADLQNGATVIKAGVILGIAALLLARGGHLAEVTLQPTTGGVALVTGVGLAMVSVLWAYEGWQFVTYSAGETTNPQHTFPRGILSGTLAVMALYLLANFGYMAALGPERAQASERIASEAAGAVLGGGAGKILAGVILVSMFSAANSIVLTSPRVYFAMAQDGLFFRRLAEVHPRFHTPAVAVIASSVWAALLAATGTFQQLLTYVVFAGWIFYGLGAASIFYYRRVQPDRPRPFRVPGYPLTPILFVASAAAIVLNTFVTQPRQALVGMGLVLLGVPAYLFWRHRT